MNEICIREYGLLVEGNADQNTLHVASITNPIAWEFLEGLAFSNDKRNRFIETAVYSGKKALRVVNFVGVITTPDGTQIEILPKTSEDGKDAGQTRLLLWKMLGLVENLRFLETTDAQLMLSNQPLLEALISIFLGHAAALVRRGIRKDYERVEEEERFSRGRLRIMQQLRQPPGRQHLFQLEYDVFSEDRAENRLLHAALVQVVTWSRSAGNQRLARELLRSFDRVPESSDYRQDFSHWRNGRDMIYYQPLLPWIRLILNQQSPFTLKDRHAGISLLFPMEVLFEKYVARVLETQLESLGLSLKTQLKSEHLSYKPKAFLLKPDLGIYQEEKLICVLDTKWKLIDQATKHQNDAEDRKAGIEQSDMYQLFAYGHKYLGGRGKLVLIYPKWASFAMPLSTFQLGEEMTLDAFPFDMEADCCMALQTLMSTYLAEAKASKQY